MQLPPCWPRRLQASLISTPTIPEVLDVVGVNLQDRSLSKQLHALSFGVGGKLDEAKNDEFWEGVGGNVVDPALDCVGELTVETFPNCAASLVKSELVVTVLPSAEMLTIPNWPWIDVAGKYEKATMPDHSGVIWVE